MSAQIKTFTDKQLLEYLKTNNIKYKIDTDSLISVLPMVESYGDLSPEEIAADMNFYPKIQISDYTDVDLFLLKSCGPLEFDAENSIKLHNLQTVYGDLNARSARNVTTNNLEKTYGRLGLCVAKTAELESLAEVGSSFDVGMLKSLKLGKLKKVGYHFDAHSAKNIVANDLEIIGGQLNCSDKLRMFEVNSLQMVGGKPFAEHPLAARAKAVPV